MSIALSKKYDNVEEKEKYIHIHDLDVFNYTISICEKYVLLFGVVQFTCDSQMAL